MTAALAAVSRLDDGRPQPGDHALAARFDAHCQLFAADPWAHLDQPEPEDDMALTLSNFPLHQQPVPTDRVRFTDGSTSDYKPPFMTVDPRAIACTEHHVGCDCREAHLREDILEYKNEERIWVQAAEEIVGEHEQETCMCTGCQIIRHREVVSKRLIAEARAKLATAPDWKPLEALLPDGQPDEWMWMSRLVHDSVTIEQYKHRETRGYLNLSADGRAWRVEYTAGDPWDTSIPMIEVITQEQAFRDARVWPWSLNDPEHPAPAWMPRREAVQP